MKHNTVSPAVLEKQSTSDAGDYKMPLCTFWHIFLTQSACNGSWERKGCKFAVASSFWIECRFQVPRQTTDYNLISRGVTGLSSRLLYNGNIGSRQSQQWRFILILFSLYVPHSPRHHKLLCRPTLHWSITSVDKRIFLRKQATSSSLLRCKITRVGKSWVSEGGKHNALKVAQQLYRMTEPEKYASFT